MRYCYYCGASMNDEAKFCPACGAGTGTQPSPAKEPVKAAVNAGAQPAEQSKPRKKAHQAPLWLVFVFGGLLVLAVALSAALYALGMVSVGGGKKTEGKGYESPEAAMEAYADALAKHDVPGMLSTFAVETLAEKYDFAMLLKQREVYASAMQAYCPDNPYGRDLSVEAVRGNISSSLFQQYKNLVGYENNIELNGVMQAFNSSREAKSFADCFNDSELFQSVELVRIVEPDEVFRAFGADNLLERETNQKNIQMNTEIYGAEAMNEGCLELMIDGEKYWVFLRQVQYDGKWYNEGFHGMMPMILGIDVQVNLVDVKSIPEY